MLIRALVNVFVSVFIVNSANAENTALAPQLILELRIRRLNAISLPFNRTDHLAGIGSYAASSDNLFDKARKAA